MGLESDHLTAEEKMKARVKETALLEEKRRAREVIWHRTTWMYRAILGLLLVASIASLVASNKIHRDAVDMRAELRVAQQTLDRGRAERNAYQDTQRTLTCQVLVKQGGSSELCNVKAIQPAP